MRFKFGRLVATAAQVAGVGVAMAGLWLIAGTAVTLIVGGVVLAAAGAGKEAGVI